MDVSFNISYGSWSYFKHFLKHTKLCGNQKQRTKGTIANDITFLYLLHNCMSSCHVRFSEWIYSCLNFKELLARNRRDIWSLIDSNKIWIHNHLVPKQTLNHLVKLASLAKWSSVCLRTKWLWIGIPLLSLKLHI